MSSVSVLSLEYRTVSELSKVINDLLVTLKKLRLGMGDQSPKAAYREREHLAQILDTLIILLDDSSQARVSSAVAAQIPGAFINRLLQEHQGDLEWYLADLKRISAAIRGNWNELSVKDIKCLDYMAAVADAETSGVFRQLMRR